MGLAMTTKHRDETQQDPNAALEQAKGSLQQAIAELQFQAKHNSPVRQDIIDRLNAILREL
jgi:hypothetical protein